ncbi:MAG: HAD family hydrolase [Candidatus Rokubacteria bacterium]|nr:HAD family hydrolase [Candidatus Rokubacteria bacterium]MBI3827515.1 HAD family hydrolase [Candidatus Rokubacteria bacterium]
MSSRSARAAGFAARARRVRALVLDVDGVLTDRRMILSERGDELKSFDTRDGIGIGLARRAGFKTALITGEKSPIAQARGDRLGVDAVVLGARRKADALERLLAEWGLGPETAAYVGDDLLDIPALQRAGLAIAVADAAPEVRAVAHAVTRARGGRGAVRECVERILRAQGRWREVVTAFVVEHGGAPGAWR